MFTYIQTQNLGLYNYGSYQSVKLAVFLLSLELVQHCSSLRKVLWTQILMHCLSCSLEFRNESLSKGPKEVFYFQQS